MDFPNMIRLRQTFDRTKVTDIPGAVQAELKKLALEQRVRPGQRIALTGGSRGIANIALILKSAADYLKSIGASPFIFPAMGSHGGATAEGQTALLAHYRVTETFTGAPVFSSMDTVEISRTQDGVPVFIDKNAFEADGIIVVNRIKPHTKFKAPIESGLMKMMAIGMGKQKGAEYYHKAAIQHTFAKIIVDAGREVLKKAPILCGLGLVENGYDQTALIAALLPDELEEFMKLPHVVAQLGNDKIGAGLDLLLELVVLDHLLRLVALERRDGAAVEELGRLELGRLCRRPHLESGVQLADQLEGMHRVEIEDRLGPSAETADGIVARHDQQVADACAGQAVQEPLQLVPVLVLAGEMDQGFDAHPDDLGAEKLGRDGGVAARIVGNRQPVDLSAFHGGFGAAKDDLLSLFRGPPAGHQLPGYRKDRLVEQGLLELVFHGSPLSKKAPRCVEPRLELQPGIGVEDISHQDLGRFCVIQLLLGQ